MRLSSKPIISRKFLHNTTAYGIVVELKKVFDMANEDCVLLNSSNNILDGGVTVGEIIHQHKVYCGKTRLYLGVQVGAPMFIYYSTHNNHLNNTISLNLKCRHHKVIKWYMQS